MDFRKFRAVVLDMNGTMIDDAKFHKLAWKIFAKQQGMTLADETYEKFYGRHNNEILPILFNRELSQGDIDLFAEQKETIYRKEYKPYIKEVRGLTSFLKKLKEKQYQVALATTSPKVNCEFILNNLRLNKYFDVVVTSDEVAHGKPDPEIYQMALDKLRIKTEEAVVFEDSPVGVEAAKAAGIFTVGITIYHSRDQLSNADYFISNFEQISTQF